MGIEVYCGSLDSQVESTTAMTKSQLDSYKELGNSLEKVENSASDLSGKAYDSFRAFIASVIIPLKETGIALAEATQRDVKSLPKEYRAQVADEDLQEDKLIEDIQHYDQLIADNQASIDAIEVNKSTSSGNFQNLQRLQSLQKLGDTYSAARDKLQEKLDKLRAFNASSPEIFGDIDALAQAIDTGVGQLASSWDANTGTYSIPADLSWTTVAGELKANRDFAKKYQIERPQNLSWKEYNSYITGLRQQAEELKKVDGWDDEAVKNYINQVKSSTAKLQTGQEFYNKRDELYAQTKEVGSDVYTGMYAASKMSSREKLELVLKHLGAEVDEHNFMHLTSATHKFSDKMPPHGDFLMYFRKDVILTFKDKSLKEDKSGLGQQVHLFRYYLDRQAIYYIRNNYEGDSDYEKLLAYGEEQGLTFDYTTGANYHNRYDKDTDVFRRPYNMKVQVPQENTFDQENDFNNARMVEFIVNLETGEFETQWDAYDQHKLPNGRYDSNPEHYTYDELHEIANTESFNYGPSKGDNKPNKGIYVGQHNRLDVTQPADSELRQKAKSIFKSEDDLGKKGGQYADIVKGGGHKDYEAWQERTKGMSEKEKVAEYNKYKEYASGIKPSNRGYYGYSRSKQYQKDHK